MFALAIVLYALTRMGSPVLAGWLAFAAMAPGLAISPVAGALIDRVGSVWAITVDMAASAACVAALIAVDRLGWANPPVLLTLTGLFSLTSPLSMAGIRALLPRLVPVAALDRANALDTAINGLTDIVGPALAGALDGLRRTDAGAEHDRRHLRGRSDLHRQHPSTARTIAAPGPLLAQAWSGLLHVVRQPTLRGLAVVLFAVRDFVGHACRGRCRCSRHDNSPAVRARRSPACSGPVLASSAALPP